MLHTPVTFAPNALAICTAKVPTPPDAPIDQHALAGLEAAAVAEGLQGSDGGHRDGGRLLEGQIRRHPGQPIRSRHGVLGE